MSEGGISLDHPIPTRIGLVVVAGTYVTKSCPILIGSHRLQKTIAELRNASNDDYFGCSKPGAGPDGCRRRMAELPAAAPLLFFFFVAQSEVRLYALAA